MSWIGRGARLLLVEDDEVDRMAIERLVQRENLPWVVTAVGSLAERGRSSSTVTSTSCSPITTSPTATVSSCSNRRRACR
ncbi:MAG: hypothetical protein HC897_17985 [Thermoanaerobaculia bacterium]|nr:hypothetical protein [Thermoanaerobaculia bacterium]